MHKKLQETALATASKTAASTITVITPDASKKILSGLVMPDGCENLADQIEGTVISLIGVTIPSK